MIDEKKVELCTLATQIHIDQNAMVDFKKTSRNVVERFFELCSQDVNIISDLVAADINFDPKEFEKFRGEVIKRKFAVAAYENSKVTNKLFKVVHTNENAKEETRESVVIASDMYHYNYEDNKGKTISMEGRFELSEDNKEVAYTDALVRCTKKDLKTGECKVSDMYMVIMDEEESKIYNNGFEFSSREDKSKLSEEKAPHYEEVLDLFKEMTCIDNNFIEKSLLCTDIEESKESQMTS